LYNKKIIIALRSIKIRVVDQGFLFYISQTLILYFTNFWMVKIFIYPGDKKIIELLTNSKSRFSFPKLHEKYACTLKKDKRSVMYWGVFCYFYIGLFVIFKLMRGVLVILQWFFIWKGYGACDYVPTCWWCLRSFNNVCDVTGCPNLVIHYVLRSATTSPICWCSSWRQLMGCLSVVGVYFFFLFPLSKRKYMYVLFSFSFFNSSPYVLDGLISSLILLQKFLLFQFSF